MITTVIIFIAVLSIIVFVHEMGHFVAARKNGVAVEEFGFGFPPRIFGIKRKDTIYSINWIPVGGFVKIKGEDGSSEKENDSYASKPIWRRATIISAGVFMNIVLSIVLLSIGFGIGLPSIIDDAKSHHTLKDSKVQIVEIAENTPAEVAGLEVGDEIIKIDDQDIYSIENVQNYNQDKIGDTVTLQINRYGETQELKLALADLDESGTGKMGVSLVRTAIVSYPWYESIWLGFKTTFELLWAIIVAFYQIVAGLFVGEPLPADIAGPVGIAVVTGQVAQLGFIYLLQFTAILSLNLAIINFFPFPALDGGRFLFLMIEKIRGKTVDRKVENMIHNIGFTILMLVFVLITFRDVNKFRDNIFSFFKNIFS